MPHLMIDSLEYIFLYLHMTCASFWLGSLLYTEIVLWPRLRRTGELERIQPKLRSVRSRQWMGVFIVGTVLSGFALGLANGVFDQLFTPYGLNFLLGSLVGVSMMVWWVSFPPRSMKWGWRLFYSGFWVVLGFMVGMRVTAT